MYIKDTVVPDLFFFSLKNLQTVTLLFRSAVHHIQVEMPIKYRGLNITFHVICIVK